jgi:hypothetical protein
MKVITDSAWRTVLQLYMVYDGDMAEDDFPFQDLLSGMA